MTNDVRFATFNVSLNRSAEEELIADLYNPDNSQAQAVAEIIQRNNPDVLLLNEFDYDLIGDFDPALLPVGYPSSDHRLVSVDVDVNVTANVTPEIVDNNLNTVTELEFLGEVTFDTGFVFADTEVGGISGLTYDATNDLYYGLSDDRSKVNDARFYTIGIDLNDGSLDEGDVEFQDVTTLLNAGGRAFTSSSLDPEGIALTDEGTLFIASEGDGNNLVDPFIAEFSLDGQIFDELTIPDKFLPTVDKRLLLDFSDLGIRLDNSEAVSFGATLPDGRQSLIVASDNNFNDVQVTQFLAFAIDTETIPTITPKKNLGKSGQP